MLVLKGIAPHILTLCSNFHHLWLKTILNLIDCSCLKNRQWHWINCSLSDYYVLPFDFFFSVISVHIQSHLLKPSSTSASHLQAVIKAMKFLFDLLVGSFMKRKVRPVLVKRCRAVFSQFPLLTPCLNPSESLIIDAMLWLTTSSVRTCIDRWQPLRDSLWHQWLHLISINMQWFIYFLSSCYSTHELINVFCFAWQNVCICVKVSSGTFFLSILLMASSLFFYYHNASHLKWRQVKHKLAHNFNDVCTQNVRLFFTPVIL